MTLLGFLFTGLKVVGGRPDYRIYSRTIKRGFWLGNSFPTRLSLPLGVDEDLGHYGGGPGFV
jgi:hypothetical protein